MAGDVHGRRAFTLVELLVVVAIIAMLLALLEPLVNKAMQIARKAQCATNLKVIGSAVHMFAGTRFGRALRHAVNTDGTYVGFWGELAYCGLIGNRMRKGVYEKGMLDCPEVYRDLTYLYWMQTFVVNGEVDAGDAPHPFALGGQPYTDPVRGIGQAGSHGMLVPGPRRASSFSPCAGRSRTSPGRVGSSCSGNARTLAAIVSLGPGITMTLWFSTPRAGLRSADIMPIRVLLVQAHGAEGPFHLPGPGAGQLPVHRRSRGESKDEGPPELQG